MNGTCKTKYPIILVHGIGYDDQNYGGYWGRIPEFLKNHGADIYFGNQDAFGSVLHNSQQLMSTVEKVVKETGAQKVNLIAHSKGGIEARHMISCRAGSQYVASLTTLATPHRGVIPMDQLKSKARVLYKSLLAVFNFMLRIDGGEKNSSMDTYEQLTADYMAVFNQLVPDVEGVYYQSYAFDMKNTKSDPAMSVFYSITQKLEGPNDGLVSVESAKWGDFRGVYSGPGNYGISHPNAVDSKQRPLIKEQTGGGILDITDLYWDIASRLKALGY